MINYKHNSRYTWIIGQLDKHYHLDVLNREFVDDYIKEFNPSHIITSFGANRCRQLGKDLSDMYNIGFLKRSRIGIKMGYSFPKWVYCYERGENTKYMLWLVLKSKHLVVKSLSVGKERIL